MGEDEGQAENLPTLTLDTFVFFALASIIGAMVWELFKKLVKFTED
jgi:hypothetical protein